MCLLEVFAIQNKRCIEEVVSYLLSQCEKHCPNDKASVKSFRDTMHCAAGCVTGIVIHERFLNIPMDIGPPMLESMMLVIGS